MMWASDDGLDQGGAGFTGPGWPRLSGFPGWSGDLDDQGRHSEEAIQYASTSSGGSDRRAWQRRPARPRAASAGRHHAGGHYGGYVHGVAGLGIPDLALGGPGDMGDPVPQECEAELPASRRSRSAGRSSSGAPSIKIANCAAGVLARINEALTKLDGPAPQESQDGCLNGDPGCRTARGVRGRAGRPAGGRPQSASTPRSGCAGATPPRRHNGPSHGPMAWDGADGWA